MKERKIHPGAVNGGNAKPSNNPRAFMLGIGSRRGKTNRQGHNPWLNLKEMQAGSMRRGYMLTRDGIVLGLTTGAVGNGFVFEKLKERLPTENAPKDWEGSHGWVVVDGKRLGMASMLLDSGLGNRMIRRPDVEARSDPDDGTPIEVFLLSGKLSYRFNVGDAKNPAAPRRVTWLHSDSSFFVNTGRRVLANFDYLYDADGGYLGLRPTRKQP